MRAEAVIDRSVVAANVQRMREVAGVPVMAVVKANGYGHGAIEIARTVRAAGGEWLGVALPSEALALREAGDRGPILAWLWTPGDPDVPAAVAAGCDLSVSSLWALDEIAAAARAAGVRARVHIKVDTGLSRNGALPDQWEVLAHAAARSPVEVVGVWSHLSSGDIPGDPTVDEQQAAFEQACAVLDGAGLEPRIRHLANSAATLLHPQVRYDLVRSGILVMGVPPAPGLGADLVRPAMSLVTQLAGVKVIPAGTGVSYGRSWVAQEATRIGLVPLGYADGIPRTAPGRAQVTVRGRRCPVIGRVAMDQFVIAIEGDAEPGDEVLVFGDGARGEATVQDWATACGTIGYEIVSRIGPRVPRRYTGSVPSAEGA